MSVTKVLYKWLLRGARRIDSSAINKSLLVALPDKMFDYSSGDVISLTGGSEPKLNEHIRRINSGGEYYKPEAFVEREVRSSFRSPVGDISVGFQALKRMNATLAVAATLPDRRTTQTTQFPVDVGPLTLVETRLPDLGKILLSHPVSCLHAQMFHRTIVLITQSGQEEIRGLILNKPLEVKLGSALSDSKLKALLKSCADCRLYLGGPVAFQELTILHPNVEELMPDSYAINESISLTEDCEAVAQAVLEQKVAPEELKFFSGQCLWAPEQLDVEMRRNVWFAAHDGGYGRGGVTDLAFSSYSKPSRRTKNEKSLLGAFRDQLWSDALRRLGSEYEEIATFADFSDEDLRHTDIGLLMKEHHEFLQDELDAAMAHDW